MMQDQPVVSQPAPSLQHRLAGRSLRSALLSGVAWVCALIASVPLLSVLYMLIMRGGSRLSWEVLSELPPAGFEMGGGFGNALVGTFVMVGIAALIAIPVGILAAIFLSELGPSSKLANIARFAAKTLTGLPSILAGVFAYAMVVLAEDLRPRLGDQAVRSQVERDLAQLLAEVNATVAEYEQLKMLVVAREPWTIEAGTLTPTMKIRRARIETAVAPQLEAWYRTSGQVVWA